MNTRRFLSLLLGIALVLTSGVPPGSRTQTSSLTTGFAPSPVEANHRVASNAPSETVSPAANQIAITDAGFYPSVLTVTLDTEVMWVNETVGTHVLVSGEPWRLYLPVVMRDAALSAHVGASVHRQAPPGFTAEEPLFTAELPPGGIFTYTFTAVGEYPYYLSTALQSTGRVVVQGTELPPDPESVAPPVDDTVATTMISATQFLYTGPNPIQPGVVPGTIEGRRVAVLRGKALTREGVPLSGVAVSVHDHPEYGQTLSREDGMYDLAANGGGELVLDYEKEGYLPVQRHVQVPWQDYVWLPDVALIARDPRVTTIDLTLGTMQVARGSVVSDDDGTRQATVLFPAGTEAEVILADGSTQAVMVLHVRTTEFTVGERGPEAMPGELPPTNGYTYAGEFTVDEAVAKVDGKDVLFSQPVFVYLENFLSFPTGTAIPVGTYDDERALWVPSENGCVVEILTISGGLAQLDTTGDGAADNGAALGVTAEERAQLAALYTVGQSLWRMPMEHFSFRDFNWGMAPSLDAEAPSLADWLTEFFSNPLCWVGLCDKPGASTIHSQSQTLGESVGVTGTPFRLHYESDRVPGFQAAYTLRVPVSDEDLPASLKRIDVEIQIAGRVFTASLPPDPNQTYTLTWDGEDAYGRLLQGTQPVGIRVGYVYDGYYQDPADVDRTFGHTGRGEPISFDPARTEYTFWQEWEQSIGTWDARGQGLGGWTLSAHHAYDPVGGVLLLGDGGRRTVSVVDRTLDTFAGTTAGYSGDGGPATEAQIARPGGLAMGPDGSLYFAEGNQVIRRVRPDGTIETVAGMGPAYRGYNGDDIPALDAWLNAPRDVDLGPDGSLVIADRDNHRIRRVGVDGIITTVAGTGTAGSGGEGGPATEAQLDRPTGVAVGGDGSLYIADTGNHRVCQVGVDGTLHTIAGNGAAGPGGDGGPAVDGQLSGPVSLAYAPDGSLLIADSGNRRVRQISASGIITTVAGGGWINDHEGGLATEAAFQDCTGVALDDEGAIILLAKASYGVQRIYRVGADGILTTLAGGGGWLGYSFGGDGGPAPASAFAWSEGVETGPDAGVYIADTGNERVRRVLPPYPGFGYGEIAIASEDGLELYQFDPFGRHLRTLDTLTGATVYTFTYNTEGLLIEVEGGDGDVTVIQRSGGITPTAIIGPFGQQTELALNSDGYWESIIDPLGYAYAFTYAGEGLLETVEDPRGHVFRYEYDGEGRLTRDESPVGGAVELARVEGRASYTVTLTTAENRESVYQVELLPSADGRNCNTFPDGTQNVALFGQDGATQVTYADGTVIDQVEGADPRFEMQAPLITDLEITTPGGLHYQRAAERAVELEDLANSVSLRALTDTVEINGRTTVGAYDAASRAWTVTTPEGRQVLVATDDQSRPVELAVTGIDPLELSYDGHGRLEEAAQSTRRHTFVYHPTSGYLASHTDPLSETTAYERDAVGRVITFTLPDGAAWGFMWDEKDNLTSLVEPDLATTHLFTYTEVDLLGSYRSPLGAVERFSYNRDRQLVRRETPSGGAMEWAYNAGDQLTAVEAPEGDHVFSYDGDTGLLSEALSRDGQEVEYGYDGGLLTQASWGGVVTGTVEYGYDDDLRLSSIAYGGQLLPVTYDEDKLITGVGSVALSRDAGNGLLTGLSDGGYEVSDGRNSYGEVSTVAVRQGSALYNADTAYDDLGRIVQRVETIGGSALTWEYEYDEVGQLTGVKRDDVLVESYQYDGVGNRIGVENSLTGVSLAPGDYVYDADHKLLQAGAATYTHDGDGRLHTASEGSETTTYHYGTDGTLAAVALPGGQQITYEHDSYGRRVARAVDGVRTHGWLYGGGLLPLVEVDGVGSVRTAFTYAVGPSPVRMERGGVTYHVVSDHLGSPRLVVNAGGTVVKRVDYDAYGNVIVDSDPSFDLPFGFAGGMSDPDHELIRFGVRDYQPSTGRWTGKDPMLFSGDLHVYGYVDNDPVNARDPVGLKGRTIPLDMTTEGGGEGINLNQPQLAPNLLAYVGVGQEQQPGHPGADHLATPAVRIAARFMNDETLPGPTRFPGGVKGCVPSSPGSAGTMIAKGQTYPTAPSTSDTRVTGRKASGDLVRSGEKHPQNKTRGPRIPVSDFHMIQGTDTAGVGA